MAITISLEDYTTNSQRINFLRSQVVKYNWKNCALIFDETKITMINEEYNLSGVYCSENDVLFSAPEEFNSNVTFVVQILTTKNNDGAQNMETDENMPPTSNALRRTPNWFILHTLPGP
jgi:hypothetical protein